LAIDASNVYWVDTGDLAGNNGAVMQVAANGASLPVPLAPSQPFPQGIAADGTSVYWSTSFDAQRSSSSGEIRKIPIGGGAITPLATGQDAPGPVARDASFVYWANTGMSSPAIRKALKAGGGSPLNVLMGVYPSTGALAVDSNNIYLTVSFMAINRVDRIPLNTPSEIVIGKGAPGGIAIDSTSVYWADSGNNAIHKASIAAVDTTTATDVATNQSAPSGVAVDSTGIYWANSGNGTIMKLAPGQTVPTTLAQAQSNTWAIAVDATTVYWTNNVAGGAVMKLAK